MKKEKIATISCLTICVVAVIIILNQGFIQNLNFENLFSMLGIVFIFFSMACTPWMFFKPINEIANLHNSTDTVILKVEHVNIARYVGIFFVVIAPGVLKLF